MGLLELWSMQSEKPRIGFGSRPGCMDYIYGS